MAIETPTAAYVLPANNGGTTYTFTFTKTQDDDVFVYVFNTSTGNFDLKSVSSDYTLSGSTITFGSAPSTQVLILRRTDFNSLKVPNFIAGSAIRGQDLDANFNQLIQVNQEFRDLKVDKASPEVWADLNMNGKKVDGRVVSTDGTKLDGIEAGATADQTAAEVRALVQAASDSHVFTDADNSKLDGIETGATADQTAAEIRTLVQSASDSHVFTDSDNTKLDAINLSTGITTSQIANSAVTTAKLADAELVELATMGGNTASALADLTQAEVQILDGATVTTVELNTLDGVTATATEINQLDGNTLKASSTDFTSSIQFPSAAEIDSRITARIDPLGGFEAIADEDNFPASAPPVGTVISIANANSLAVNSSGVGAGTRAGGSDAVVINGFPSGFNSTSLDDGIGLLVIATSTAHTYDFHRVVAKNEDVRQLSSDINDFKARYRIGSSNPTTDNDAGDLFFNTGTSKMLVRNAGNSAWQEVQAVGDFFINTISSSSGTGGGSATFNSSAYRFTLSNAPITAQQLLVSINGVVQKPNSGTSQPSEGFVLNGADIIFSAAPASGAAGFFVTIGSSVGIGTPSDNTVSTAKLVNSAVTSAKIADGTIVNADVNASAAIAGSKISPNFGSQNVITTGSVGIGTASPGATLDVNASSASTYVAQFADSATSKPAKIYVDANGIGLVRDNFDDGIEFASNTARIYVNGSQRLRIDSSGRVGVGTTSPTRDLEVSKAGSAFIRAINTTNSVNIDVLAGTSVAFVGPQSNHPLAFQTNNTERLRIDSSGKVGVGTSSPGGKLSIVTTTNTPGNSFSGFTDSYLAVQTGTSAASSGLGFGYDSTNNHGLILSVSPSVAWRPLRYIAGDHRFEITGGIEKARLDSSGRLLVGETSASGAGRLVVSGNTVNNEDSIITIDRGSATTSSGQTLGRINFTNGGDNVVHAAILAQTDAACGSNDNPGRLVFSTSADGASSPTERMRINSSGGFDQFSNDRFHVRSARTNAVTGVFVCFSGASSISTGTEVFLVNANGDCKNTNNSFGAISDSKLKESIVNANSQWNDVKNLQVRNYNFKAETGFNTHTQIGLIAQEVEHVSPGLVSESINETTGESTKSVNYSVLYMKAVKALQEAMTRIETLETQNASLEARLTALEGGS